MSLRFKRGCLGTSKAAASWSKAEIDSRKASFVFWGEGLQRMGMVVVVVVVVLGFAGAGAGGGGRILGSGVPYLNTSILTWSWSLKEPL